MGQKEMEPKEDVELSHLLKEWQAPEVPPALERRVLGARQSWWRVLLLGYIRVPVPVACCAAILMIAGAWRIMAPATHCAGSNVQSSVTNHLISSPPEPACRLNSAC